MTGEATVAVAHRMSYLQGKLLNAVLWFTKVWEPLSFSNHCTHLYTTGNTSLCCCIVADLTISQLLAADVNGVEVIGVLVGTYDLNYNKNNMRDI